MILNWAIILDFEVRVRDVARRHATQRLAVFADVPPISVVPMFLPDLIQLAVVCVFGVWARSDIAQCVASFDWVGASFGCGVATERSGISRIKIP